MHPIAVVQAQLDAYNARSLDAFMRVFSEDAAIFELGESTPTFFGKDAIRDRYAKLFEASPHLHSEVLTRQCLGNTVIDLERITGRLGATEPTTLLAIYQVRDGLIRKVHFARE